MPATPPFWTEEVEVREFETDPDGFAQISSIANHMQHAAGNHASALGFSMQTLLDQNITWILSRLSLHIIRPMRAGERIRIETWPSGADRLFAYRDFELFDESGNMVLAGRTTWLILDIVRRRPVPTPSEILDLGDLFERKARISALPRFPRLDGPPDRTLRFPVRRADLDINRHVNNVKYLEMILEVLAEDDKDARPAHIEIQFKAESMYGDVLVAERYPAAMANPGESASASPPIPLRITRESDGKELCTAMIVP